MRIYTPDAGDVVWLDFDPQIGREQAGYRPAIVLSPKLYNIKSGLMVCCPLTSKIKNYPFEVLLESKSQTSAVLSDQVKSLDWQARNITFKSKCSDQELQEILRKIKALLNL